VQSAAVGQSGLGTKKIGSGSENVIMVLIRAGSFVVARTAPVCPAACHRCLARRDKLDGIFVKSAEVARWARQP
jgi:hypothetical protein